MGYGLQWNAWVSFCGSLACQFAAGNMYLFSTYSAELKEVLFKGDENGQSKLQTIALIGNIFAFMPVAGVWYDSKWGGVTSTILIGVLLTFSGYFMLYLVLALEWDCGLYLACLFAGLWGHGAGYYDAAALTCGVKNLPHHRGLIVGMQKAFLGLAGAVITRSGVAFFNNAKDKYLLFISIICSVPAIVATVFLCETTPVPDTDKGARKKLITSFGILGFLAIVILIASLVQAVSGDGEDDTTVEYIAFGIGMLCIASLMVLLSWKTGPYRISKKSTTYMEKSMGTIKDAEANENPLHDEATKLVTPDEEQEEGIPPTEALKTIDFWLLFIVLGVGTGGGLTIINNASQMVTAKGKDDQEIDISVSLLYVFNSMGRIFLALFSDKMEAVGITRLTVLSSTVFVHGLSHAVLMLPSGDAAYPGFCLAGMSYGGMQAVFPAVVSDLFGIRYFASNYMWMMFAPSLGSLGFSTLLASGVYEKYQSPPSENGDIECHGDACFFVTHLVVGLCCVLAACIGMYLNYRTSRSEVEQRQRNRKSARLSAANIHAFGND